MAGQSWATCAPPVRRQVEQFIDALHESLADRTPPFDSSATSLDETGPQYEAGLVGVYLHGSLAMGCFNPNRSDVDLLVVTSAGMGAQTKRCIANLLLRSSGQPRPIEISFLYRDQLVPWTYPTPFDFHYSEDWRHCYEADLANGAWMRWNERA